MQIFQTLIGGMHFRERSQKTQMSSAVGSALEIISTHYELAKRVEQIFQCSALCSSQMYKKYLLEYTVQYCGSKFPGF
jgi:hypothetical protein